MPHKFHLYLIIILPFVLIVLSIFSFRFYLCFAAARSKKNNPFKNIAVKTEVVKTVPKLTHFKTCLGICETVKV